MFSSALRWECRQLRLNIALVTAQTVSTHRNLDNFVFSPNKHMWSHIYVLLSWPTYTPNLTQSYFISTFVHSLSDFNVPLCWRCCILQSTKSKLRVVSSLCIRSIFSTIYHSRGCSILVGGILRATLRRRGTAILHAFGHSPVAIQIGLKIIHPCTRETHENGNRAESRNGILLDVTNICSGFEDSVDLLRGYTRSRISRSECVRSCDC